MSIKIEEFRKKVAQLPREEIIGLIRDQDPDLVKQIKRIEWVFENKLHHLTWNDGTPIEGRPLTNEELALILDPPFSPSRELRDMGFDRDVQEQIHISSDPVLWAKAFLGVNPRVYQILILRDPSKRRVLRMGRRAGKTFCMAIMLLHYSYTTENGRCLIMAPMKTQVALVFDEVMKLAKQGAVIESITRSITSPQHEINFTNGSTMRFFTTGLKSGGKADIARGQEAHLIILDEMDYMGIEDVNAIYAMLQKTSDNQPDKMLIGASTPTGRREKFWEWCTQSKYFKEFYWPAYVNPLWTKEIEEEQRAEHTTEMHYRHEIEADWGEDAEGVYPRRYVDVAFVEPEWEYVPRRTSARSVYFMGVDWDKYRAGPNIVVLEACGEDYEDSRFANKLRIAYREEIPPGEYALTKAVDRVIELNGYFNPEHIYIDRGYGDTQLELLHKYGVENPSTGLKKKVRGIQFRESIEVRDPATKQMVKKEIKPYMVENLRSLLEEYSILFSSHDEELYMQLISYVVIRTSAFGLPVFGPSGSQVDHAHDALILACLAYTENYGDLHKIDIVRKSIAISNETFLPTFGLSDSPGAAELEKEIIEEKWGDENQAPVRRYRSGVPRRKPRKKISRKMF